MGANDFNLDDLDKLFEDEGTNGQETPPADGQAEPAKEEPNKVDETKAFAHRLKEKTEQAIAAERERIATSLGYASYADMENSKQKKMLEQEGLDPEQVQPIVDKLVQERLANDPRMKELESYRQQQAQQFAQRELASLSELTGVKYNSLDDLPKDVVEDWRKTGSLKKSYLTLHGEELITQARNNAAKGTMSHMQPPAGAPVPTDGPKKRLLTEDEKRVWRLFNPRMTDEELNKKEIEE